jgi:2-keto-4-pentenoate hydratase/2-oxohepta-3-ene-1,7-dioic acid hydratase in catechol pathway
MRSIRFAYTNTNRPCWGLVESGTVDVLAEPPFARIKRSGRRLPLRSIRLLPPSIPSKIILVGLNYRAHAAEMAMRIPDEPVIFLKPPTSLIAHADAIVYPRGVKRLDFEAELALVIKKTAKDIRPRETAAHIFGYTCLNDVTARDLQKKDGQWTRSKSFDTFCPVGPWIETNYNPRGRRVAAILNGAIKQEGSTRDFIFPPDRLVSFISSVMTLYPGDIISTGTPAGVGRMEPGDTIAVDIDGIGRLENKVVSLSRRAAAAYCN